MIITHGLTRTVILTRRWAVKVPRLSSHGDGFAGALWSFARGVLANQSEREASGSAGVCPVRWTLAGLINVYPRCAPVEHELTDADYAATGFIGPVEKKPANVGYLDGRLVFVDYDMNWNDQPPCAHTRHGAVSSLRQRIRGRGDTSTPSDRLRLVEFP